MTARAKALFLETEGSIDVLARALRQARAIRQST